jgi:GNAT superfamily N-acetyltransferase
VKHHITVSAMRDVPVGLRSRMRELSLGPIAWGAWSWTFHDGSCWAALAFDRDALVGWAALTEETDVLPVVGVYVAETHRGRGLAATLMTTLLRSLLGARVLAPGAQVYNSSWRWSKYAKIIESCGLRSLAWGVDEPESGAVDPGLTPPSERGSV